ncbi:hypothetical protein [Cryptosporangium japonicum]|uniref:Uncharacterized protein n=1 Tax=Cryptosporangium japonicum TaxID=80872 RepID=A0ABN0UNL1_9ACTN
MTMSLVDNELLSAVEHDGTRYYELVQDRLIEPIRFGGRRGLSQPTRYPDALVVEADHAVDEGDYLLAERGPGSTSISKARSPRRTTWRVRSRWTPRSRSEPTPGNSGG